jgi:hypothetical protein
MGFLFGGVHFRRNRMFTSLLIVVTAGLTGIPGDAPALSWQSYSSASQQVEKAKKPMAVFLGTGQKGWDKVAGNLGAEAETVLAASYLCAYVDTNTPEGKTLAQAFEIKDGVGLVLSDRKGEAQVYWHEGNLTQADLVHELVRHSTSTRTSHYPTEGGISGTTILQQSGSYCPNCSGGRHR